MKKLILMFFIFCLYILNYNIVKASDENLGLYGFYLGQGIEDAIKNANDKGYTSINIEYPNFLKGKFLNNLSNIKDVHITTIQKISLSIPLWNFLNRLDKIDEYYNKNINISNNVLNLIYDGLPQFAEYGKYKNNLKYVIINFNASDPSRIKPTVGINFLFDTENSVSKILSIQINAYESKEADTIDNILKDRFGEQKLFMDAKHAGDKIYIRNIGENCKLLTFYPKKTAPLNTIGFYDMNYIKDYCNYYINIDNQVKKSIEGKSLEGI